MSKEGQRLVKEGEWAERNAEEAALNGEKRRQRNAELLAAIDLRKLKALNRKASALVAEGEREVGIQNDCEREALRDPSNVTAAEVAEARAACQ